MGSPSSVSRERAMPPSPARSPSTPSAHPLSPSGPGRWRMCACWRPSWPARWSAWARTTSSTSSRWATRRAPYLRTRSFSSSRTPRSLDPGYRFNCPPTPPRCTTRASWRWSSAGRAKTSRLPVPLRTSSATRSPTMSQPGTSSRPTGSGRAPRGTTRSVRWARGSSPIWTRRTCRSEPRSMACCARTVAPR